MEQGQSAAAKATATALTELAICAALAVCATWPLPRFAATNLPLGYEATSTVPLLNCWTVWWNTDRMAHGLANYWQAPIFFPDPHAFVFSEAQPLTIAFSPLVWMSGAALAYNAYLLASLTLNGWLALRLFHRLGIARTPAWAASALLIVLPFVHWQLGVLQLIPLWGVLWTLLELQRLHATPAEGTQAAVFSGLRLGLPFGVTYLLCNYYGLFLSVLLTLSAPWLLGRRLLECKTLISLGAAGLIAGLLISPVVIMQLRTAHQDHEWRRDPQLVRSLSAEALDYTTPVVSRSNRPATWANPQRASIWRLSPGWVCTLLAVVGAVSGLSHSRQRAWTALCLSLVVWSFLFSLGTTYHIGGWSPYRGLAAIWPGFEHIRSPFRFAVFVQLGLAILAASGLQAFTSCVATGEKPRRSRAWQCVTLGAVWLPAGIGVVENWPRPAVLADAPRAVGAEHWAHWLESHTPSEAVISCLPLPMESTAEAYVTEAEWMFWQSVHHRRMTNGYSGFFPDSYWEMANACRDFPSAEAFNHLREVGVGYCVVHRARLSTTQTEQLQRQSDQFPLLYDDVEREVSIHGLRAAGTSATALPPSAR